MSDDDEAMKRARYFLMGPPVRHRSGRKSGTRDPESPPAHLAYPSDALLWATSHRAGKLGLDYRLSEGSLPLLVDLLSNQDAGIVSSALMGLSLNGARIEHDESDNDHVTLPDGTNYERPFNRDPDPRTEAEIAEAIAKRIGEIQRNSDRGWRKFIRGILIETIVTLALALGAFFASGPARLALIVLALIFAVVLVWGIIGLVLANWLRGLVS